MKFFGQTEISGRWGSQGSQNLTGWKKLVSLAGIFTDLLFELKSKKLCNFKDDQFGIFEKHGCPPPLWNELPHKENFYLAWTAIKNQHLSEASIVTQKSSIREVLSTTSKIFGKKQVFVIQCFLKFSYLNNKTKKKIKEQ